MFFINLSPLLRDFFPPFISLKQWHNWGKPQMNPWPCTYQVKQKMLMHCSWKSVPEWETFIAHGREMRGSGLILIVPCLETHSEWHMKTTYHIAIMRNTEVLKPWEPRYCGSKTQWHTQENLQKVNKCHEDSKQDPLQELYNLLNISTGTTLP